MAKISDVKNEWLVFAAVIAITSVFIIASSAKWQFIGFWGLTICIVVSFAVPNDCNDGQYFMKVGIKTLAAIILSFLVLYFPLVSYAKSEFVKNSMIEEYGSPYNDPDLPPEEFRMRAMSFRQFKNTADYFAPYQARNDHGVLSIFVGALFSAWMVYRRRKSPTPPEETAG